MNKVEIINGLNDLLTRARDAQKGYQEAAKNVEDIQLKKWLMDNSTTRRKAADRIESEIKLLGGTPDGKASFLGKLHRSWIDLKSNVIDGDEVILTECLRGEERALEDYRSVLNKIEMGMGTELMLQDHLHEIAASLETLRILEATLLVTQTEA